MRSCSHVGSGGGRLLPSHAAADGFELKTGILSGFHGASHGFAYEHWNFDSTLLDIQNHRSGRRHVGLLCSLSR
jgi:hypothetical protein